MASSDPFDDIINLEEEFYSDGYKAGVADGARAGRIEGRSFGIEKGYEKFVEAGRLYGKSVVWANRLPQAQASSASTEQQKLLPALNSGGVRLEKNVLTLHALVEPETLSTENSDEAVNDFDDRVKRAQGKARVIERQVGEEGVKKDGTANLVEGDKAASPSEQAQTQTPAPAPAPAAGAGVEF